MCFADQDGFCDALDTLLGDPSVRSRMADDGARYVMAEFSWQAVRHRLLGALDEWS